MLTSTVLAQSITRIAEQIMAIRDQLNGADAKLGDGDTGMTVTRIVESWHGVTATLPVDLGEALLTYSRQCARVSGSSLGAVLAVGLSGAARSAQGQDALDGAGVARVLAAATDAIMKRSGATPGDKTVLDSLLALQAALGNADTRLSMGTVATTATAKALEDFRSRESKLGRARMYGAKSIGQDDPGMLAAHLMLRVAVDGRMD